MGLDPNAQSASSKQQAADNPFRWVFLSDVCKHCEEAGCLEACPTGSIIRTEGGSVLVQRSWPSLFYDEANLPGRVGVSPAGFGILPKQSFSQSALAKSSRWQDAIAGRRDAHPTRD
jgi:hypothetical protein